MKYQEIKLIVFAPIAFIAILALTLLLVNTIVNSNSWIYHLVFIIGMSAIFMTFHYLAQDKKDGEKPRDKENQK